MILVETNYSDKDLIHRETVIETLNGQKLEKIEQASDPQDAEIVRQAWNEAIEDCITAIKEL